MSDVQRTIPFEDQVFTINEAAAHLRVGRSFLYTEIAAGKLTPAKFGSRTVIGGDELRRYRSAAQDAAA